MGQRRRPPPRADIDDIDGDERDDIDEDDDIGQKPFGKQNNQNYLTVEEQE